MKTRTQTVKAYINETARKNVKLIYQLDVTRSHRKKLLSILRKMIVQQKRAAKRLKDPQATATVIEIEAEFKAIQKLIRENKAT